MKSKIICITAALSFIISAAAYNFLPEQIPVHYDITTQRISPAAAGGGFYLSAQSEYNLRLNGSDSTNRLCLLKAEL